MKKLKKYHFNFSEALILKKIAAAAPNIVITSVKVSPKSKPNILDNTGEMVIRIDQIVFDCIQDLISVIV